MAELRRTVTLWGRLVGVQMRSQMQYRASFLFELFGTVLVAATEFAAVALVLPRFGDIGGWSLGEVSLLYGTVNLAFGLMDMVFSGFDPDRFGLMVRQGGFDPLLLRPVEITTQVLGSSFALRRLGRVAVGVGNLALGVALTRVDWSADKLVLLIVVVLSQIAYFGGLYLIGATITFWTLESIEAVNIFTYGGTELISYPMTIYPNWMRRFFTYILPAIFLNYYPLVYVLERVDPLGLPRGVAWLAPLAGLLLFAVAMRFWRFGISHYQSSGT